MWDTGQHFNTTLGGCFKQQTYPKKSIKMQKTWHCIDHGRTPVHSRELKQEPEHCQVPSEPGMHAPGDQQFSLFYTCTCPQVTPKVQ